MPWHLQLKNIRIERSVLLAICRIGLPGAAQSALYSISNMTIQSAINGFGTVAVAAWSVYGKIDFLFWMTVSSFGIAVTTFAGQNFGARQYDRVRRRQVPPFASAWRCILRPSCCSGCSARTMPWWRRECR